MERPSHDPVNQRFTYRVAINLDQACNPIGGYIARYDDGALEEFCVMAPNWGAPFDHPAEWARELVDEIQRRWGVQLQLDLG